MIGAQGYFDFCAGHLAPPSLNAVATLSVERGAPEHFAV